MGACQVGVAFALARNQQRHVPGRLGPLLRFPAEAFQGTFVVGQLDGGIAVVLGVLVIVEMIQVSVLERSVNHLGFHLVHGGQYAVLFQEEDGRGAAQRIEAREGIGGVEIGHHLRSPDLVVALGRLFNGNERIGEQVRPLHLLVFDHHEDTVAHILPVAFVVKDGVLVQAHQGIQV